MTSVAVTQQEGVSRAWRGRVGLIGLVMALVGIGLAVITVNFIDPIADWTFAFVKWF